METQKEREARRARAFELREKLEDELRKEGEKVAKWAERNCDCTYSHML